MNTRTEHQQRVDALFSATAPHWQDLYEHDGLQGEIFRRRLMVAVEWVDELGLAPGSRVLDAGCGAGLLTAALAQRHFQVTALDSAEAMLDATRRRAGEAGVSGQVDPLLADVHCLPFPDGAFALVTALGVVPWLHSPERGVAELRRVTAPGGHVLLTSDNSWRLCHVMDPRWSPLVRPLREAAKWSLRRANLRGERDKVIGERRLSPRQLERMVTDAGLVVRRTTTLGFGPFSFMGRTVVSDARGRRFDRRLQDLADRDRWVARRSGNHEVVVAVRP